MKKYSWSAVTFGDCDPQLVGEELETLEEKGGEVTSASVLEFAKQYTTSEIHKCFEWDNNIASEKYRMIQASNLLSSISFVINEDSKPIEKQKVYVGIVNKERKRVFKNIEDVVKDDNSYEQLINKTRTELENLKTKYEKLLKKEDFKELIFSVYKTL